MAYIMSLCREFNLMTYTTLCHCELPSITSKNKDFVEVFENHGGVFIPDKNGIKALDEMKHHGTDNFDFVNNHLPTYLYDELKVIRKVLEEVNSKLQKYDRVVLISDHGASRLSVISGQENKHEMNEKGIHSGRCCPKSEADEKPSCAIDGEDFWVLANYDRFKGSRPANIEVHGGATLEEVVVEDVLLQGLKKYNIDFIRNGSSNRVPGNISLSFKNANGEMLLHRLDLMGIMVSTGSACDSTNTQMSHVLKAIKIPEKYGFGTIRISFNHENTEEDAKYIAESIGKILTTVANAKLKRS